MPPPVQKLVVVSAENLDPTMEFSHVALINPDETPYNPTHDILDSLQLRSPNGTVFTVSVTDDGTLEVS